MVVALASVETWERALSQLGEPFRVVERAGRHEILEEGRSWGRDEAGERAAIVPACRLEDLGDSRFRAEHRLRYACMSGAMANGIGSVGLVEAMGRNGLLGIFGSAGLSLEAIKKALDQFDRSLGEQIPFGMNLIHSPGEPELESAVVDLYLRRGVRLVEASAFLNLTLPVVRYRVAGIRRDGSGRIFAANRIIAKVSRVEVASKFMAPPPEPLVKELLARGQISAEQAEWSSRDSDGR